MSTKGYVSGLTVSCAMDWRDMQFVEGHKRTCYNELPERVIGCTALHCHEKRHHAHLICVAANYDLVKFDYALTSEKDISLAQQRQT